MKILAVSAVPRDPRMNFGHRFPDQVAKRLGLDIYYFTPKRRGFYYLGAIIGVIQGFKNFIKTARKYDHLLCFIPELVPFCFASRIPFSFVAVDDYEGFVYTRSFRYYLFVFIKRFIISRSLVIICPALYIAERYKENLPPNRIQIIRVGVDTKFFRKSSKIHKIGKIPVLYYHGKIRTDYNIAMMITALTYLKNKAILLLVGDGPQMNEMKKHARMLRVENKVQFLGKKSREELPGLMEGADICLNPIPLLGNKLFQYFSMGKPVVSLKGLVTEIAEDRVHLVFAKKDPRDFAEAIDFLIDHSEKAAQFGKNARERILNQDWEKILAKFTLLFRKIKHQNYAKKLKSSEEHIKDQAKGTI